MFNQLLRPVLERLPENNRLERIWKLAQVDFRRRYYDNSLGLFWALLNPIFRVIVYYFAFTILFQSRTENFALYLFSGLIFWLFFSESTRKGLSILTQKRYLIENIQFNKLDLYYSAIFSVFLGFLFNFVAYIIVYIFVGINPTWNILHIPILISNIFILALAVTILLSTIHIYFKDIVHLWDMAMLLGFWLTPIIYTPAQIPERYHFIFYLNPVSGIIINTRLTTLNASPPDYYLYFFDLAYAFGFLLLSVFLFKRYSHVAAEKY